MGGVDLYDKMLGSYRPRIRGKKWYYPLIVNALNTSVVASWKLYGCIHDSHISHLNYRREVAMCLLKSARAAPSQIRGPQMPLDVRYDGVGHFPKAVTQGRCKRCGKNVRVMCIKCNVRLHRDTENMCWDFYHDPTCS